MLERITGKPQTPDIYQEVRQIGAEGVPQIGVAGPEPGSPGAKPTQGTEGTLITSEAGSAMIVPAATKSPDGMAIHANSEGSVQDETATNARYRTVVQSRMKTPVYKSPARVGETSVTRRVTARDEGTRAEFKDPIGRYPREYTHEFGDQSKAKAAKLMAGMVIKQAERDAPPEQHKKAA